jgi:hypothetical protein
MTNLAICVRCNRLYYSYSVYDDSQSQKGVFIHWATGPEIPFEYITIVLCSAKMWIIIYTTIITEYRIYFEEAPDTDICWLE